MIFPEKLDRLMGRAGLTQTSLGGRLGVSQRAVGKWINGESRPSPEIAAALARELHVTYDQLFDDSVDLPPISEQLSESAEAHDEQDATVIKGAIAKPAGVAAKLEPGWARALAQQLREMADKIDPDHPGALKEVARVKTEVDQAATPQPAKSRRPAS